jgi:NAD(P)H-flavin reductase
MGPTGQPSAIPRNEKVLLVGGGLGNAILFSIGQALKEKGSQVLYFAAYRSVEDRFKAQEIEAAADQVVWCSQTAPGFRPARPQDISFIGVLPQALTSYAQALLQPALFKWSDLDRLLVIGPTGMMEAVAQLCANELQHKPGFKAFAGINSPMQCMMKGICAQCLQRHVDPLTGQEKIVYSCAAQDQELHLIDFACLHSRLQQNHVQEALNRQWLESAVLT